VREAADQPAAGALAAALREARLLLVIDNVEQVLAAAPQVAHLLAACPHLTTLATSRRRLRLTGERVFPVPPLAVPDRGEQGAAALAGVEAVRLFAARAEEADPAFALTEADAAAVAEVCRRLDGLPLAIELAAARIKVLPPQAMLSRAGNRLKLLSGGSRDLPERQQTMRAALSWGYNLLDATEQELFATLSVFRGGFSVEQAERLIDSDALDGIASLIDKAFVRRDVASSDDAPRFTMLETIREYGLECLAAQQRDAAVRRAHAQLMAAIAEENELDVERLAMDADNFRTAIDWATMTGDAELALRLGAALWWSWYVRGHYANGRHALATILAIPGGEQVAVRAKAMTGAGAMAFLQCDYEGAIESLDASIVLSRKYEDPVSLAHALQFRGSIARERGEYEHAIDLHLLSRTLWAELEDRANEGRSLNYVGFAAWLSRDFARTAELCEGTLQLFRERQDTEGVTWSLLNLAAVSLYSGKLDRAYERLDECLSWSRAGGFKEGIAWSLNLLGYVARARGEFVQAETMLEDSLRLHWELGDRWRSASVLEALGGVRRDPRLLGAAASLRARLGTPVPPVEHAQWKEDTAAVGVAPFDVADAVRLVI
jgi:non-specific serine/threonine protein kinase